MHPLTPDLSKLTDDELHKKRGELMNRLTFAYRMGHSDIVGQAQLILGDYEAEISRRNQKMLEEMQKTNPGFKDKIDIK